nr:hypothetical protein [bacterium]
MVDLLNTFGLSRAAEALDGYFSRTQAATPTIAPEFAGDSAFVFWPTNENEYYKAIAHLDGRGGALVAVGSLMPFVYGSRGASHVYAVDADATVPYVSIPLLGALMAMAPNRAKFLEYMLAKPVPKGDSRFEDSSKTGVSLLSAFHDIRPDPDLAASIDVLISEELGRRVSYLIRDKVKESALKGLARLRSLYSFDKTSGIPHAKLLRLTYDDVAKKGGPLANEAEFKSQRALFIGGKMTGVAADLAGEAWRRFLGRIEGDVGTVYISNIESWLIGDYQMNSDFAPVHSFYENLLAVPGADEALVVSSSAVKEMRTRVYPLRSYVEAAIPLELSKEEAVAVAANFISMRYYMNVPRERDPDSPYAPHIYPEFGDALGEAGPAIIEKAGKIVNGKKIDSDLFDRRMMEECPEYRLLRPVERRLFIRNLEIYGALVPPG